MKKTANVAQTIMQQINSMDKFALPSWGAKNFVGSSTAGEVLKDSESKEKEKVGPYLKFNVRGSKLRGFVIIALNGMDYYDLLFYNSRGMNFKLVKRIDDIDFESLINVLDNNIG